MMKCSNCKPCGNCKLSCMGYGSCKEKIGTFMFGEKKRTSKAENKHGCTCSYETLAIQDKDTCILFLNTVSLSSSIQCSNGIWVNSMFNLTKCQKQTCGYNMCNGTLKLILYHLKQYKVLQYKLINPQIIRPMCVSPDKFG